MVAGKYSDAINMELLQLATLLMRNLPSSMATHRKELIKFGWNHLKREESSNKYHAFLNVCHFLEAYQAPEKIVLQASSIRHTCLSYLRVYLVLDWFGLVWTGCLVSTCLFVLTDGTLLLHLPRCLSTHVFGSYAIEIFH